MRIRNLINAFVCCLSIVVNAQDSGSKVEWLPNSNLIEAVIWDPLAGQMGGALNAIWENSDFQEKVYATFIFGMQRSFYYKKFKNGWEFDIGLDFGAFTQFEFKDNRQNILNTDFKMGLPLSWRKDNLAIRLNVFHLSSHFGDDLIFRYDLEDYEPDPLTYEQVDFTIYGYESNLRYYGGFGIVFRSNAERKVFSLHGGVDGSEIINDAETIRFIYGAHLNLDAQTDYKIGIKPGLGFALGKKEQKPVKLILEFYTGPAPYGAFEFNTVTVLGLGLYYDAF